MLKYLKKRKKSFQFAFNGILFLWKEANFKIHIVSFIIVIALSFYFKISTTEWLFIIFSCAFVIVMEAINTVIEETLDFVSAEENKKIGRIKDMSAAFVLLAAINALIVGWIIFIPPIMNLL